MAAAAQTAGLEPQTLSLLAESIFAYIDQLAADSVEGYAQALAEREDERHRRRRLLAELLVREPPVDETAAKTAARAADWRWPRNAAVLACPEEELDRLRPRLPGDALVSAIGGVGCTVVPDPSGPGRQRQLRRTASRAAAVLGPSCPPGELARSWYVARAALTARQNGLLEAEGLLLAEDHLGELLVSEAWRIVKAIRRHRLAALESLGAKARERMEATALAYVRHAGNAAAMGRALQLHPQTVRHRLRRLRELLGDQLDDPAVRFELEAVLRSVERRAPE